MRRLASLLVVLLLPGGCAVAAGPSGPISPPRSVPPSAMPSSVPVQPSPAAGSDQPPTASPASTTIAACPTHSPLSVAVYVKAREAEWNDGVECFGGREVTVLGWADDPPVTLEWGLPLIEPAWLWFVSGYVPTLWDDPACAEEHCLGPLLFVHISPKSGLEWDASGRWVLVTGHSADPMAETCHWVYDQDWEEPRYPDSSAQAICRSNFVMTSVEDAPAPR